MIGSGHPAGGRRRCWRSPARDSAGARRLVADVGEHFGPVKDEPAPVHRLFPADRRASPLCARRLRGALRVVEGLPGRTNSRCGSSTCAGRCCPGSGCCAGSRTNGWDERDPAAKEYEAVLVQWVRADPFLHPVLGQAERGLMRLGRTTERLEAMGYQLTATRHHREDGCTPGRGGEEVASGPSGETSPADRGGLPTIADNDSLRYIPPGSSAVVAGVFGRSRKVRAPPGRLPGNAWAPQGDGQGHRKQTATRVVRVKRWGKSPPHRR